LYRNDGAKVAFFLNQYHKGKYMVFNLSQLEYDKDKFENNVMLMGWPDHHNPPLDLLFSIVKTIHSWLSADKSNVIVVHCLAGKGRTGTLIVCYLLYIGMFTTVKEALQYFAMKRTNSKNVDNENFACVDSPSQLTYVEYFYRIITKQVDHDTIIKSKPLTLRTLYLHNLPYSVITQIEHGRLHITIYQLANLGPNDVKLIPLMTLKKPDGIVVKSIVGFNVGGLVLGQDIVIVCRSVNTLVSDTIFRFAFHSAFIENNTLVKTKFEMDDALKNALLPNDFQVSLIFDTNNDNSIIADNHQINSDQTTDVSSVDISSPPAEDEELVLMRELYARKTNITEGKVLTNHEIVVDSTTVLTEEEAEQMVVVVVVEEQQETIHLDTPILEQQETIVTPDCLDTPTETAVIVPLEAIPTTTTADDE
jgi:hypothetical protein